MSYWCVCYNYSFVNYNHKKAFRLVSQYQQAIWSCPLSSKNGNKIVVLVRVRAPPQSLLTQAMSENLLMVVGNSSCKILHIVHLSIHNIFEVIIYYSKTKGSLLITECKRKLVVLVIKVTPMWWRSLEPLKSSSCLFYFHQHP